MGALQLALLLALGPGQPDSLPVYADAPTRALVARAMERHRYQDTLVNDYRAHIDYRMSFALGKRRWARLPPVAVEEQTGSVAWQRPNDLRVNIEGARSRARWADVDISSAFDRPWFVPRALGDSVRIFGQDFPDRAALHPLAADGPDWYSYALTDSVRVTTQDGRRITLYTVRVVPRRNGPSLIAGRMVLDGETAEVVRLAFRYVGTALWSSPESDTPEDSASARRENKLVSRILRVDAELEYSLQDRRYWMPYRQVIAGEVKIPVIGDIVIPFELSTTFTDYEINTGQPIPFQVAIPDSEDFVRIGRRRDSTSAVEYASDRDGSHFEIRTAPRAELSRYAWPDSLELDQSPEDAQRTFDMMQDLAHIAEDLPDELTGRRRYGIEYERVADVFRYNRVQGLSAGLGYQVDVPGVAFTRARGTVRFGLSDSRVMGQVGLVREAPEGRLSLTGYRRLAEVDVIQPVGDIGNSLNGLFAGHDNADYYLAEGVSLGYETSLGVGLDLAAEVRAEHQSSTPAEAHSAINDFFGGTGDFPGNPPVLAGNFLGTTLKLSGQGGMGSWTVAGDFLGGEGEVAARVSGEWGRSFGRANGLTLRARGGMGTAPALPQTLFRVGGLGTVRGFDYGSRIGQAFWAVQADYAVAGGLGLRPVVFMDAGQAGPLDGLAGQDLLVGGGVGVSILRGLIRFDLSHPITHDDTGLRFDIVFAAPR